MNTRSHLGRVLALDLLERLLEADIEVKADRPQLRIRPAGRLTPELEAEAGRLKPQLLDVLDPPHPEGPCPCGSIDFARRPLGPWTCRACGDLPDGDATRFYFGPERWQEATPAASPRPAEARSDHRFQTSAATADEGANAAQ